MVGQGKGRRGVGNGKDYVEGRKGKGRQKGKEGEQGVGKGVVSQFRFSSFIYLIWNKYSFFCYTTVDSVQYSRLRRKTCYFLCTHPPPPGKGTKFVAYKLAHFLLLFLWSECNVARNITQTCSPDFRQILCIATFTYFKSYFKKVRVLPFYKTKDRNSYFVRFISLTDILFGRQKLLIGITYILAFNLLYLFKKCLAFFVFLLLLNIYVQ